MNLLLALLIANTDCRTELRLAVYPVNYNYVKKENIYWRKTPMFGWVKPRHLSVVDVEEVKSSRTSTHTKKVQLRYLSYQVCENGQ